MNAEGCMAKEPQVGRAIEVLMSRVGRLENLLDDLNARLSPISSDPMKVCGIDGDKKAPTILVPLASTIHAQCDKLDIITIKIEDIISRLEI